MSKYDPYTDPDCDPACRALIAAMNRFPGIQTFESCCGHGSPDHPMRIWFSADSLEALPELLYWFDGCHTGVYGWRVIAQTDCRMSPVTFRAESTEVGHTCYCEAEKIAVAMNAGWGLKAKMADEENESYEEVSGEWID